MSSTISIENKHLLKIAALTSIGVVVLYETYKYVKKSLKTKKTIIGGKGGTQQNPDPPKWTPQNDRSKWVQQIPQSTYPTYTGNYY